MLKCKICGTEILIGTGAAKELICIPCRENRSLFDDPSMNIRAFSKRLDGQCIEINKIRENSLYVEYEVLTSIWDQDPRFRSRHIKVGLSSGILRIDKNTGEIEVVYPIMFDSRDIILAKALSVLNKAFAEGVFPEKTEYTSG